VKPQKIYLKVPGRAHSHLLLRVILKAVILALAVFGLSSFYVLFFIDLNQHKDYIEQSVKQYSGLEIKLNGKLKHSIFSGLKVSATDVSLRNKDQPWLEIDSLKVAIDILPLIDKSLNISSLELGIKKLYMSPADLAELNLFDVATADNSVAKNKPTPSSTSFIAQYIPQLEQLQLQNIHLRIDDFSFIDKKKSLALQLQALDFQLSELALMQQDEFIFAQPQRFLANKFSGQFKVDAIHFNKQLVSKRLHDLKGSFSNQQGKLHLDNLNFQFQQLSGENKSRLEFGLAGKTSLNLPPQSIATSPVLGWQDIKNFELVDLDFDFNPFHIDLAAGAMDFSNTRLVIKKWRLKSQAQSLFELFSLPMEQLLLNSQLSAQIYSSQVKLPHTRINNIAINLNNNWGKIQLKLDDFSARQYFTWAANKKAELDLNINALLEAQIESSANNRINPSALFAGNIKILRAQVSSNEILLNIADEDIYRLQSSMMEISNLMLLKAGKAPSTRIRDWAEVLSGGSLEVKSNRLTMNGEGAESLRIKLRGDEDKLQVSQLDFDLAQSHYTLQAALLRVSLSRATLLRLYRFSQKPLFCQ